MRGKLLFEGDSEAAETAGKKTKKRKQRPPDGETVVHGEDGGGIRPAQDGNGTDSGGDTAASSDEIGDLPSDAATAPPAEPAAESGGGSASGGKLKFSKEEKAIGKLEGKSKKTGDKLEKAREKMPERKVRKKERVYDEEKGKAKDKLRFEKEPIPIGEAKWNRPKKQSLPGKGRKAATVAAVNKLHMEVYKVERENVGVQAAHRAELLAEGGYRGAKRVTSSAYRFHKNRPYRKVSKLETKKLKSDMKLSYKKALRDNPKLKSNALSRLHQKRKIKRTYAAAFRNAKKSAATTKQAVGVVSKVSNVVTGLIRRNPVLMLKIGLLLLLVVMILSLFSMCSAIFSGGSSFVGAVSYAAEFEDIESAALLYTELETDLRVQIAEIETTHEGYDEYIYEIGAIGHDPFMLMAFLTAVYQDFIFSDVHSVLLEVFNEQYVLTLTPSVEVMYEDGDDGSEPYNWYILTVTLESMPFAEVVYERMTPEETLHFEILMESRGARQFVGNPFDFDWLPYVTSYYGYRIHPIHGDKRLHRGIDIALPEGTEIRSGFDGTVVEVGYDADGYGNFVVVEDADGYQARYAHCHDVFVTAGQPVSLGDVIATVGNTGASTGNHLHMEVLKDGTYLNPLFFVDYN